MSDKVIAKNRAWEREDFARGLLWGVVGLGLVAASAAAGVASLVGLALLAGGIIAGVKAIGEIERAGRAGERIEDREAIRDLRAAPAVVAAPVAAAALPAVAPEPRQGPPAPERLETGKPAADTGNPPEIAPPAVVEAPASPAPEPAKSWTAAVTEKSAPEVAAAAGRGA
jgi:hypothetical protein